LLGFGLMQPPIAGATSELERAGATRAVRLGTRVRHVAVDTQIC
jgi:hypothetical protein